MMFRAGILLLCLAVADTCATRVGAQGALPGSASPGSAVIYGRTTMAGAPISGAQVSGYLLTALHGQSSLVKQCMTWTDDNGFYTCPFLPDGSYLLAVEGYGRSRIVHDAELPAALLFPATMNPDRATLVEVHKMDQQEVSFAFSQQVLAYKVSGTVHRGLVNGTLTLHAQSEQGFSYRLPIMPTIEKDGSFCFSAVPPGSYELRGRELRGRMEYNSSTSVEVRSQDLEHVDIVLVPQGSSELIASLPESIKPSQVSIEMVEVESGHRALIHVDDAPHYELSEITAGSYWLSAVSDTGDNLCIDSAQDDGRPVTLPFRVESGVPVGKLTVNTTTKCGAISGVLDSHTAGSVVITDDNTHVISTAHTDSKGEFSVGGMVAGSYRVFAWQKIEGVAYRSHDLLRKHLKDSVAVEVKKSDFGNLIRIHPIDN